MNDSTSTTSPAWPTHWPERSFEPLPTALFILAVAGVFAVLLAIGIASLRFHGYSLASPTDTLLVPALAIQLVCEAAAIALILLFLPRLSGFSLSELGFRPPSAKVILFALGGAVAMTIVTNGGASLLEWITHTKHDQQVVQMFQHIHDPRAIAFFAVFAIVFGPIAEESIFRVFFFNLALRYTGHWPAIAISAVLFGLAHWDVFAFIPLALGGAVLAYVYYRTGNAFASMITHGVFNSLTICALLYAPQLTK